MSPTVPGRVIKWKYFWASGTPVAPSSDIAVSTSFQNRKRWSRVSVPSLTRFLNARARFRACLAAGPRAPARPHSRKAPGPCHTGGGPGFPMAPEEGARRGQVLHTPRSVTAGRSPTLGIAPGKAEREGSEGRRDKRAFLLKGEGLQGT